jgi:hypothetical protein
MIEGVSLGENERERECMWERMIEGVSVEETDRERECMWVKRKSYMLLCVMCLFYVCD